MTHYHHPDNLGVVNNVPGLKIIHQNLQGMVGKLDILDVFLQCENPDVFCISEHHLRDYECEAVYLNGYNNIASYCRKSMHRGGVCIFVKSSVQYEEVHVDNFCLEGHCELAAARIGYNGVYLLLVVVYKPKPFSSSLDEHNSFYELLSACLERIIKPNIRTVVVGDFNVDLSHSCIKTSSLTCMMKSHGLVNKVKSFTREQRNSKSLIDLAFTDLSSCVFQCDVLITALSDHHAQVSVVGREDSTRTENLFLFKRSFGNNNIQIFKNLLQRESWCDVFNADSMNAKMDSFFVAVQLAFDQAFPEKKIKVKPKPLHFKVPLNKELMDMRNLVRQWWFFTRDLDNSQPKKQFYFSLKSRYRAIIRNVKSSVVVDRLKNSSNKAKAAWDIINSHRNTSKSSGKKILGIKDENGSLIKDPKTISNMFNDFFIDVTHQSDVIDGKNTFHREPTAFVAASFFLTPVTADEVADIIKSLKPKTSAGTDNVSPKLLKDCSQFFIQPLVHLINCSFENGKFPDLLKLSTVKPLHKKGNIEELDNFRPISITSTFSKIFEKAVMNRLWSFIHKNGILFANQFGFVKERSTISAIFALTNSVVQALDRGDFAAGIFFDLRKAFDMVSHERLLEKLELIGVRGVPKEWFRSFLVGRRQAVNVSSDEGGIVGKCCSDVKVVKAGVPQGSILGPLLFVIFVNDIVRSVTAAETYLFADDTSLVINDKSRNIMEVNTFVQSNNILQWFDDNCLLVNTTKTSLIDFNISSRSNDLLSVYMEDVVIESNHTVKFLGITLDSNLKYHAHVVNVGSKMGSGLFVLRRLSFFTNRDMLLAAYYALIYPHLSYAVGVWGSEDNHTKQLFLMQKRAVRIIAHLKPRESCRSYFTSLKLLTFPSIYIFHSLIFLKQNPRIYEHLVPQSKYQIRNRNKLNIPRHKTSFFKNQLFYNSIIFFNALPDTLRMETNNISFKNSLKKFLICKRYYSIKEYLNDVVS